MPVDQGPRTGCGVDGLHPANHDGMGGAVDHFFYRAVEGRWCADQQAGDVRHFGMSKEGMVARQFMLGVVQTAEGLPIYHEVFDGNTSEAPTLLPTVRKVLARYPHIRRLVMVADRGLLSVDNLADLSAISLPDVQADLEPAQIVQRYKSLADIERGFRVLKSEIEIAPVYHRLPERIRAHASICFMALILYRVMRQRLKAAGHSASPESALAQLRKIQRQSVAINQGVPVSGISNIHREQADLLAAMNIRKPVPDAQLSLL